MNESTNRQLIIDVHQRDDGVVVVQVAGQIIRENQSELRDELVRRAAGNPPGIAVDLAKVDYMDSAGLGCCSMIHKLLQQKSGGTMVVFGASENLEKTWNLIRLDLVIPMFSSEDDAVHWIRDHSSRSP